MPACLGHCYCLSTAYPAHTPGCHTPPPAARRLTYRVAPHAKRAFGVAAFLPAFCHLLTFCGWDCTFALTFRPAGLPAAPPSPLHAAAYTRRSAVAMPDPTTTTYIACFTAWNVYCTTHRTVPCRCAAHRFIYNTIPATPSTVHRTRACTACAAVAQDAAHLKLCAFLPCRAYLPSLYVTCTLLRRATVQFCFLVPTGFLVWT